MQRAQIDIEYREGDPEVEALLFRLSQAALTTAIHPIEVTEVEDNPLQLPFVPFGE